MTHRIRSLLFVIGFPVACALAVWAWHLTELLPHNYGQVCNWGNSSPFWPFASCPPRQSHLKKFITWDKVTLNQLLMVGLVIVALAAPLYVVIFALFDTRKKNQRHALLYFLKALSILVGVIWMLVVMYAWAAYLIHTIAQWFSDEERIAITAGGKYAVKGGQYIFSNANAVQLLSVIGQAIFAGVSVFLTSAYVFFTWRALRQQRDLSAEKDRNIQSQAEEQTRIVEQQIEATLQSSAALGRIADNLEAITLLLNSQQNNSQSPGSNSNGQSSRHQEASKP